ncbi:MAG: hypothetical protein ACP5VR_10675 [Acidimicrobiales bacterium]
MGLASSLCAVVAGEAERLWVGRDYRQPARLVDGDKGLLPVTDSEVPGALGDAVDLVLERSVLVGAHVEMIDRVPNGLGIERIAVQLGRLVDIYEGVGLELDQAPESKAPVPVPAARERLGEAGPVHQDSPRAA